MTRLRTLGQFTLVAVLAGTGFVGIKAGLAGVPPVLFAALRFDIAALILVGLLVAREDEWLPRRRADYAGLVVGGVFIVAVPNTFLFVGQQSATSGFAAVVFSFIPVVTPAFATVLLPDTRRTVVEYLGIAVGLVGVLFVLDPGPAMLASTSAAGGVLIAVAATSLAFGTVLLRRADPSLSTLAVTAWSMPVGSLLIHAVSFGLAESPSAVSLSLSTVGAVLYVGVLSTAALYPLLFGLIARIGPVRTNLYAYVSPVVAAVVGWLVLGERLAPTTVVGFLVIAVGFALVERDTLRVEVRRWRAAD